MAQSSRAYEPSRTAIQTQLGALDSQYATTEAKINRNYEQQQSQLENQRNQAAEASSLAAAGSGGAFGGAGNLARRKYYEQTFVPAQTQLQTNKANEIDAAAQNRESQRTSLNAQLANLEAQANQQALQKYWAEVEAERQRQWEAEQAEKSRQAQLAAARASNPYQYLDDGYGNKGNSGGKVKAWDFGNGYVVYDDGGEAIYTHNGQQKTRGEFLSNANIGNWNLWKDIWNSGTKTNGVGSDTIALYNKLGNNTYLKNMLRNDKRTSYLY